MSKPTLEEEIRLFLKSWNCEKQVNFLRDLVPIFELYDVDSHNNWLSDTVGPEDLHNIRLVRTVYLISRLAEFHAADLCFLKNKFRYIYRRLEKVASLNA